MRATRATLEEERKPFFVLLAEAIFKLAVNAVSKATMSRPGIPAEAAAAGVPMAISGPSHGAITLRGPADK